MKYTALLLSLFVLSYPPAGVGQEFTKGQCQQLHKRIEQYTKLRRNGGSARQMESWKQSRKRYEERFRQGDCYKYGVRLK